MAYRRSSSPEPVAPSLAPRADALADEIRVFLDNDPAALNLSVNETRDLEERVLLQLALYGNVGRDIEAAMEASIRTEFAALKARASLVAAGLASQVSAS